MAVTIPFFRPDPSKNGPSAESVLGALPAATLVALATMMEVSIAATAALSVVRAYAIGVLL